MSREKDAEQADLIRRIASIIGHEVRNPLAVLNNSAYFVKAKLTAGGALDPKIEKHLGIMSAEIARADGMLADMLTFARPLELMKSGVVLAKMAEGVIAAVVAPAKVKISLKAPKTAVEVVADEKRLADALKRLLDNAVEAVGESGSIVVTLSKEKDLAVLEVRDSGPGVKAEVAPYLGQPFRTGKPRGMGLGLALARKILEAHGGRFEGGDAQGGGASFRLVLPAA